MAEVFGDPITDKTLTVFDRARLAITMKNANNKAEHARTYLESLGGKFGESTHCLLYNATGNPMKYVASKDWHGHIGSAPHPIDIANGQWGAFVHESGPWIPIGSTAATVYRGKHGMTGVVTDYVMAWYNPSFGNNLVWSEVREATKNEDFNDEMWNLIYENLVNKGRDNYETSWNECCSKITIGGNRRTIMDVTFALEDLPEDKVNINASRSSSSHGMETTSTLEDAANARS